MKRGQDEYLTIMPFARPYRQSLFMIKWAYMLLYNKMLSLV